MDVELKYGSRKIAIAIPATAEVSVLEPLQVPVLGSVPAAVSEALAAPLGCAGLETLIARTRPRTVAIAVPDETRPAPLREVLPPLMDRIQSGLARPLAESVIFFIGGGLHPPADAAAIARILPPGVARGCRIVAHDARTAAMRDYGMTRRGTPVRINADYAGADLKIVIGQVDPHQFVGFTGGSKGVVIGCAAPETIEKNHSLMSHPSARVGRLAGNPVREDLTEAGETVGIDLAVNFVLDADKRPVHLAAGNPARVLESCAEICARVYGVAIEQKFDIEIPVRDVWNLNQVKDVIDYLARRGVVVP